MTKFVVKGSWSLFLYMFKGMLIVIKDVFFESFKRGGGGDSEEAVGLLGGLVNFAANIGEYIGPWFGFGLEEVATSS